MPTMCPSSRCQPGAILLGIVLPDGSVAFAKNRIAVDGAFVDNATQGRPAEKRFRFSSPCVRSGCHQWTGDRCGVIDSVLHDATVADYHGSPLLPECSIRQECRWFSQTGAAACAVCDQIVTDSVSMEE